MFILLLPLLALLMTWATRRFRFAPLPTVVLATLTAAAAWGILLLSTRLPSGPGEAEAFDSARYMVREVPREWLTGDLAERYGWLCGLVLYLLCWVTAKAWPGSRHA